MEFCYFSCINKTTFTPSNFSLRCSCKIDSPGHIAMFILHHYMAPSLPYSAYHLIARGLLGQCEKQSNTPHLSDRCLVSCSTMLLRFPSEAWLNISNSKSINFYAVWYKGIPFSTWDRYKSNPKKTHILVKANKTPNICLMKSIEKRFLTCM